MSSPFFRRFSVLILVAGVASVSSLVLGQSTPTDVSASSSSDKSQNGSAAKKDTPTPTTGSSKTPADYDKRTNAVSAKTKRQQEKEFKKEVSKVYRKWLDEDVAYIIHPGCGDARWCGRRGCA